MKKGFQYLIGIAIILALPWLLNLAGGYWVQLLIMVGIFGIMASSLNLVLGYTGQANLAHGVLFGVGAYTSALLVMRLGVNFWLTIPIAGVTGVTIAFVIGFVSLRLRGTYFAIITLGFMGVMVALFTSLRGLTGGSRGLMPIPQVSIAGITLHKTEQAIVWVYIVLGFLLLTIFIVDRIVHSRIGRAFIAIREDEDLAKSSGINTFWYKMLSFCIASFLAAIAGAIYATFMGMITPQEGAFVPMLMALGGIAVGGMGTMLGPLIGTIFFQILPELLRFAEVYYYMIFAAILVVVILRFPEGIMGAINSLWARFKARGSREDSAQYT